MPFTTQEKARIPSVSSKMNRDIHSVQFRDITANCARNCTEWMSKFSKMKIGTSIKWMSQKKLHFWWKTGIWVHSRSSIPCDCAKWMSELSDNCIVMQFCCMTMQLYCMTMHVERETPCWHGHAAVFACLMRPGAPSGCVTQAVKLRNTQVLCSDGLENGISTHATIRYGCMCSNSVLEAKNCYYQ